MNHASGLSLELPKRERIANLKPSLPRCARCRGRMILDGDGADSTCFSCGHVVYAIPPVDGLSRPTSHAGQDLS